MFEGGFFMSTCEILDFNYPQYTSYKEVCVEFDEKIQHKALDLMRDYDSLTETFGVDTPEFFYDHNNENCCVLFKGNYTDLDVLEEYLKSRG